MLLMHVMDNFFVCCLLFIYLKSSKRVELFCILLIKSVKLSNCNNIILAVFKLIPGICANIIGPILFSVIADFFAKLYPKLGLK